MKKTILTSLLLISAILFTNNSQASAVYNGQVANPFVFCSLPKPCKKWCQPWRKIWEQICPAGQITGKDAQAHEIATKEVMKTNPELINGSMTAESFRKELGKANLSAFSEDDQYIKEVSDWIKYKGNQMVNGKKVSDIWCEQGIQDPLSNSQIRQSAYSDIVKKNQKIVEIISNGNFPPKNTKPWYEYKGGLKQCIINNSSINDSSS